MIMKEKFVDPRIKNLTLQDEKELELLFVNYFCGIRDEEKEKRIEDLLSLMKNMYDTYSSKTRNND